MPTWTVASAQSTSSPVHPDLARLLHRGLLGRRARSRIVPALGARQASARSPGLRAGEPDEVDGREARHVPRRAGADPDGLVRSSSRSSRTRDTCGTGNGATPPGSKPVAAKHLLRPRDARVRARPPRPPPSPRRPAGRPARARAPVGRRRRRRATSRSRRARSRPPRGRGRRRRPLLELLEPRVDRRARAAPPPRARPAPARASCEPKSTSLVSTVPAVRPGGLVGPRSLRDHWSGGATHEVWFRRVGSRTSRSYPRANARGASRTRVWRRRRRLRRRGPRTVSSVGPAVARSGSTAAPSASSGRSASRRSPSNARRMGPDDGPARAAPSRRGCTFASASRS